MLPGWQQAVPLQRTRPLKLIFEQQEMMLLSNIWLKWRVVWIHENKRGWLGLFVWRKSRYFFFCGYIRNNGAAAGIWPLITLTVNLIVDHTLTGEREMRWRSQCVVSLNCTKFSLCLSLKLLLLTVEPQCIRLAQSSKIAFVRTYFYLKKAWSSHFLYRNFSWVVQDPVLGESCISIVQLSRNMKYIWNIMHLHLVILTCHRYHWLLTCFP